MKNKGIVTFCVGLFLLLGIAGLVFLAFQVSGLSTNTLSNGYSIKADFDNVGGLKVRAPVEIGGVVIGRVTNIALNTQTFKAEATLLIDKHYLIPSDSSASILTQGLLGSNYVGISPGYAQTYLNAGDVFERTNSALILEQLIGQLMFNLKK